jgi:import inner membrane translocase subunit TIM16
MAKHLVQIIIAGAQVVGKAFTQAVRQEIRMSQEAAKKSASRQENHSAHAAETARLGMTLDEAKQILNLTTEDMLGSKDAQEKLQKSYDHLFLVNDRSKDGSFYIQSKVFRAKERIDQEIQLENNVQGESAREGQGKGT